MKRFFVLGLTAPMLLLIYALPVSAENRILEEITVRGEKESPMEESLNIREVRESPARDMGEALKQVEGVSYVRKGAIANDLVLRGFQKDNINVLVDGVRIHGACPARMDPPSFHYDFAEVEEVKVVKGPYDLTNPGGLGGTVDARTKKAAKGGGGDLNLTWSALVLNRTYRVQYKPELSANDWTDLPGDVFATTGTVSKTDTSLSAATQRFYRVILLP